jgi:DNA primase
VALTSEQIEAIRGRIDIVRMVGAYVPLKKQGQRWVGVCPFHAEKTPSFSVSAEKGLYYCFGCHAGGDIFSFLMRHRGLDFHEAARLLAKEAGVELEPESEAERNRKKELAELSRVNEFVQAFFEHALWQPPGAPARAYLAKRALPEAYARESRLGFGGSSVELATYLDAKKVPTALAQKAGLLTDDGQRCLFDGRLTFPIFDGTRRLAGFGGRRLGDGNGPKYINTRESPLFSKRRLLYGWEVAEEAIRRIGKAIIVEGYMDVLACHRAGLTHAVAALGTAFTDDHANQVSRLCKEAVLVFDGDAAGQNASYEATQKVLAAGLKTMVVALPTGRDPDSLLKEAGAVALQELVGRATPAIEHFINTAFAKADLTVEERAERAREVGPLLAALPTGLERDLYTARLAEKVGVSVDQLKQHLRPLEAKKRSAQAAIRAATQVSPSSGEGAIKLDASQAVNEPHTFEIAALKDLFLHPELRPRLADLAEFCSDPMRLLLEELASGQTPVSEVLPRHIHDPKLVASLASIRPSECENGEEPGKRANQTFEDVSRRLKGVHVEAALKALKQEQKAARERGEDTTDYDRRIQNLTRRKRELKRSDPAA